MPYFQNLTYTAQRRVYHRLGVKVSERIWLFEMAGCETIEIIDCPW